MHESQLLELKKMNLSADSKTGSGAGDRHGQYADAVHPVTSESLPARAMIVMWASSGIRTKRFTPLLRKDRCWTLAVQVLGTGTPVSSWRDELLFQVVL